MIHDNLCKSITLKKLRKSGRKSGTLPRLLKRRIIPKKKHFTYWLNFPILLEMDYMLGIAAVIRPWILFPEKGACRVLMFCILWAGMHLDCRQKIMPSKWACTHQ